MKLSKRRTLKVLISKREGQLNKTDGVFILLIHCVSILIKQNKNKNNELTSCRNKALLQTH